MSAPSMPLRLTFDGDIAVVTLDAPPVNALSAAVRAGLVETLGVVAASPARALVLVCSGSTFIAGADINEFETGLAQPDMYALTEAFDAFALPTFAAIHGSALGGGLEVAMCCTYRVAIETARLGLPEVNLGILAAAGGTQRLTRLVGPALALRMTALGEMIGAPAAFEAGLVDRLVAAEDDLTQDAIAFAKLRLAASDDPPRARDRFDKLAADDTLFQGFRNQHAKKMRGFLAPEANIEAVEAAVTLPFDAGLDVERSLLAELLASDQPAALRYGFFSERTAAKVPDITPDIKPLPIRKVGVVGAGTMGTGIAMCFANVGIPVALIEIKSEALERGLATIRGNYDRSVRNGRFSTEVVEQRMAAISPSVSMDDLADCDLVIEATFEDMAIKRAVFTDFDRICRAGAVLATNTSGLDIDEIAAGISRPEAVVGLHFGSPANILRGIEVVRGRETSREVLKTALAISRRIGKVPVVVGVGPGFVANRTMYPQRGATEALLFEGAMPWEIDQALVDFGFPMGPFAMHDLAGLDVGWDPSRSRGETLRDVFCEAGRRGQKTGSGYYDYGPDRRATPSPIAEQLIQGFFQRSGGERTRISADEIIERTLYPVINEGVKVIAEGVSQRASDIDLGWRLGYGWPAYRGGPMYYADLVGLDHIIASLRASHNEPAPLLVETARTGGLLHRLERSAK